MKKMGVQQTFPQNNRFYQYRFQTKSQSFSNFIVIYLTVREMLLDLSENQTFCREDFPSKVVDRTTTKSTNSEEEKKEKLGGEFFEELSKMENNIFQESTQIFNLLNGPLCTKVDGLGYAQIFSSRQLTEKLYRIKMNTPPYQHLSSRKKSHFLKKLGIRYLQKLDQHDYWRKGKDWADSKRNLSKIQIQSNASQNQYQNALQMIGKTKTINKLGSPFKKPKPNKVSFSQNSICKYFSSTQQVQEINNREEYTFFHI